jgi:para-nitrobenzyl esterase
VFFAPSTGGGRGVPAPNGPFKDGYVLPATDPTDQVPLLVGMVADENGAAGGANAPTMATFKAAADRMYADKAAAFLALYPVSSDADVPTMQKAAARDRTRVSLDLWAGDQLQASKRLYTYYFDRAMPWPAHPEYGAHHTSDVPYAFHNVDKVNRPSTDVDARISDMMSSYWVNFAKTGDPNGAGLPKWPAYDATSHQTMEIGERMGPMPTAGGPKLEFLLAALKK